MPKKSVKQTKKLIEEKLPQLVEEYRAEVVAELHRQGEIELKHIQEAYQRSVVFLATSGEPAPILPFGPRWRRTKARKSYDQRRGWAKKSGIGGAMTRKSVMRREKNGYRYDITRAAQAPRNYWRDFNRDKAHDSLLKQKAGWQKRHEEAMQKRFAKTGKRILGNAAKLGGKKGRARVLKVVQEMTLNLSAVTRSVRNSRTRL